MWIQFQNNTFRNLQLGKRLLYKNSWYWIRFWICWFSNFQRKKWFANRIIGRIYSRLEFSTLQKSQITIELLINYFFYSKAHWGQIISAIVPAFFQDTYLIFPVWMLHDYLVKSNLKSTPKRISTHCVYLVWLHK